MNTVRSYRSFILIFLPLFFVSFAVFGLKFVKADSGATLNVCASGCPYTDIQSAITAASAGDTIAIGAGTYAVTTSMAVSKTLTFQGDGSYPQIFFNVGGGAGNNIFNVTANNVTFRNLEIYSPINTNGTRSNYAITFTNGSRLLVDDCKLHDLRRAVYVTGGTTFTVQNSELSAMNRNMIEIGGTGAFTVTHNWIHDETFLGGSSSGVLIGRDNLAGGVGEVSYNYIEGARAAILYTPSAANSPTSGSLLIAHNTIDNTWTSTTSYYGANILTSSYNTQGIGIYDPSGHGLNSASITIRDNIIANTRWYGTHYEGGATGVLNGNLSITNSLYWNNYFDAVASGESPQHYPHEWYGTVTLPQIGWGGAGTNVISPNLNTYASDPLFIGGVKIAPSSYYALGTSSPACNSATDGQNIGAWQGVCVILHAGAVAPTVVTFNGKAFPEATLFVVDKDVPYQTLSAQQAVSNADGSFSVSFIGVLQSMHSYGLLIKDKTGVATQSKYFTIDTISNSFTVKDLLMPPTINLPSAITPRGSAALVSGYAVPGYTVSIYLDDKLQKEVVAGSDGAYRVSIDTGALDFGTHTVRAIQTDTVVNGSSDHSTTRTFYVSQLSIVSADINGDGKIDIQDLSIFLASWKSTDPAIIKKLDLNSDGKVNLTDFSILLRAIRKQ